MRTFWILCKKELRGFFWNPFGWVVLAFAALMHAISLSSAMKAFRDSPSKDSLVYVTFHTPVFWFYFLFLFPLLTMRLFAEEERRGTLETLLTAPVNTWHVVAAKYVAAYAFYCLVLLPSLIEFHLFTWVTGLPAAWSTGNLLGAYSILLLFGLAYTAFGCLASALTKSQIIAGLVTVSLLVFQYFLGYVTVIWGSGFPGSSLFDYISAQRHLHYFASGLLDTRPVVYYLSLTVFILFLTFHVVDYRRWKR